MTTASLLLAFALSTLATDEATTLATIRAAAHENFTAIHSLELQFHEYWPEQKAHLVKWDWAIEGDKFSLASLPDGKQFPGGPNVRGQFVFDGTTCYFFEYEPTALNEIAAIHRMSSIHPAYTAGAQPLVLFGWRLSAADQTFLALLDRPTTRLLGSEDVEGSPCWKVDLGEITYQGRITNRLTAWFDPAAGYWLRRLRSMPDVFPAVLAPGQMFYDYIASEMDLFDDLALGGQRWFPTRYKTIGPQRTVEIILEKIQINPTIPAGRFQVEIPVGMLVVDEPGTTKQESKYAGGAAGYDLHQKKMLEAAAEMSQTGPGNPLIDARQEGFMSWATILLGISLFMAIVGCGLWWKSRRSA